MTVGLAVGLIVGTTVGNKVWEGTGDGLFVGTGVEEGIRVMVGDSLTGGAGALKFIDRGLPKRKTTKYIIRRAITATIIYPILFPILKE